ncbi:MAG: hypothetical protein OEY03_01255 [Rhizobacter sp.]|nr:hypothetical protein [Rhizobacter sp.]
MSRPIGLERRGNELHVVIVERRRGPRTQEVPSPAQLCADLRERLLDNEHEHAARVMRHLVFVHDELGLNGWSGVEAMPGPVIATALVQAEMLASREPSEALTYMIERLRLLKVAAEMREERKSSLRVSERGEALEISEATHEEYEQMERSWVGTMPDGLTVPEHHK